MGGDALIAIEEVSQVVFCNAPPHRNAETKVRLDDVEDGGCTHTVESLKVMTTDPALNEVPREAQPQTCVEPQAGCERLETGVVEQTIRTETNHRFETVPTVALGRARSCLLPHPPGPTRAHHGLCVRVPVVTRDSHRELRVDEGI